MSHPYPQDVPPEVEPVPKQLWQPFIQDPKFLIAAAAVLLGVVLVRLRQSAPIPGKKSRGGIPNVLLLGASDAGKTALFAQLAQGVRIETHTSMKSSNTVVAIPRDISEPEQDKKTVRLVDLPGHPRLQDEVKLQLGSADGVVFLVDVQALLRNPGAVAELLAPILVTLASRSIRTNEPARVLLLASKADLLIRPSPTTICPDIPITTRQTAIDRMTSILSREMDRLKQTRAGTGGRIEGIGKVASTASGWKSFFGLGGGGVKEMDDGDVEEDEGLVWSGKGPFRWEDVEGIEFSWGAAALGAVRNGSNGAGEEGAGLKEVREWLNDL